MLPDDSRLLSGARRALAGLAPDIAPGARATLDAIDCVLGELLLRNERDFYRRYHAEGIALVQEGVALAHGLGKTVDVPAAATNAPAAEDLCTDALFREIEVTLRALEDIVRAVVTRPEAAEYLARVVDFENTFHSRHAALPPAPPPAASSNFTPENLLAYLKQKFPEWPNLEVRDVRVLAGGFSKKTVLLDVRDDKHGDQCFVLRVEQPPRFGFWDGDQVVNEFPVLQLAYEAGLPVPEALWLESDPKYVGQKFLVSRRATGQNVGSAVGASTTTPPELIRNAMRELVRIHQTKFDANDARVKQSHLRDWVGLPTLTASTTKWVEHWLDWVRKNQPRPSPLTARLTEWLRANVPVCDEPPSLLHGDFGLHNILVENGKISAVLDWEYLIVGDPAEDLAMFTISLGGQMSKEDVVKLYVDCGGRPISEYRLLYFDLFYAMKFIVPCENGLRLYQDNPEASIGLCKWGFTYTIAGVGTLNQKIALAEAAKAKERR